MWGAASAAIATILIMVWLVCTNAGDISYGRLNKIPFQEIQWYHAMAPALLLVLNTNRCTSQYIFFSVKCIR